MEDRSHEQKAWYEFGQILLNSNGTYEVRDLMIRWNERFEFEDDSLMYIYDCHRITVPLDSVIQHGREAVEYYLEMSKDAVISMAQDLLTQAEGFNGT